MNNDLKRLIYIKHKLVNVINVSKIISIHYHEFNKTFNFKGESHDFWELVYIDSGTVIVEAGKNKYTLNKGDIIFHKPNEFHSIAADTKQPSNVFVISFVSNSESMNYFKNKKTTLPKNLKPYIETILNERRETFDFNFKQKGYYGLKLKEVYPFGGQQIIRTSLEQLLIMLIRTQECSSDSPVIFHNKEHFNNHLVESVIELLNQNIYGKITVDEICQKIHYSKTYLSKIFKKHCGCTIINYYNNLKTKEAKMLLRNQKYTINQISDMLGFNDPHYFSRVFKKNTNRTPSEYIQSVSR